jgi:MurNAc alpha-1-phosphate uridylyltransferase
MQVVILAGGQATRLGDIAVNKPKSLISIQGKTFLEYQLESLERGNIGDVVLCVGHMAEKVQGYIGDGKRYGMNIQYSVEDRLLGTAGALKKAGPLLDDPFITMYGDSFLSLDFDAVMRYFKSHDKLALMTVYRNEDLYDRSNAAVDGDTVTKYSKTERTKDTVFIDYGANIFSKKVLEMVPADRFYTLEELFPRLIEMGELLAYEVKERFYEIGSPQGLREVEEHVKGAR